MCANQVGLSSPNPAPMGRKRTVNHDLPPHMARKGTRYYYVCNEPRRWIPLGKDFAVALRRWAQIEAGNAPQALTVAELVQRYVDREERAANTQKAYRGFLRVIAQAFPDPAADLRAKHVAQWRESPAQLCRKPYVNGVIALLNAAFKLGHELGLSELLTVASWNLEARTRYITDDEFILIREAAPEWLKIAIGMGYLTALRPSDIRALQWSSAGQSLEVMTAKTKQRIAFAITPELSPILAAARQRRVVGLFVVANDKGRRISRGVFERGWRAACEAAGVEGAQFRDVRAKAATDAKKGGQDYQALLGHSSRRMSDRYIKTRETLMVEPVRRKL